MLKPLTYFRRYLYEIGDYATCLQLANTASGACKDKNSLCYANLRNTAGACYFDMNKLQDCRRDYQTALAIQEGESDSDGFKVSNMLHNMGNVETASGRFEEAKKYFEKAIKSRIEQGDSAAFQLALTYLCMGRLYYLWGMHDEARKHISTSDTLFVRTSGADTHLLAL
jgi:tetratricopeptide (TPR) repeat protein